MISDLKGTIKVHKKMFLVRRIASLYPSTLLKSEALHKHFSQILLFLNVSYILHNTCNDYVSTISQGA